MRNFGKFVLGAAILAGGLGLGATSAQAAEFRVIVGGPVAYVPPCPGPGYTWVAGYYSNGYWVAGVWRHTGVGFVPARGRVYIDRDHNRGYDYRDDHRHDDHDDHFRR
jgi:hypothetical protein